MRYVYGTDLGTLVARRNVTLHSSAEFLWAGKPS